MCPASIPAAGLENIARVLGELKKRMAQAEERRKAPVLFESEGNDQKGEAPGEDGTQADDESVDTPGN